MKINNVLITNWEAPGKEWWDGVEANPDEPLIEATIKITLSWREYQEMLSANRRARGSDLPEWRKELDAIPTGVT